jgi:hypothetical protein
MQAKHKNTGRWGGVKPCLSDFQVCPTAKKCGPGGDVGRSALGEQEAGAVVDVGRSAALGEQEAGAGVDVGRSHHLESRKQVL